MIAISFSALVLTAGASFAFAAFDFLRKLPDGISTRLDCWFSN